MLKSYSNFNIDEVKSALQKAIRRGKCWETLQWTVEMFEANTTDMQMLKSNRTNLLNRLLVISVEDVSPSNYAAILVVWHLIKNNQDNVLAYMTVALQLCIYSKSRVNDWACHYYEYKPNEIDPYLLADNLKRCIINKDVLGSLYNFTQLASSSLYIKNHKYRKPLYLFWVVVNTLYPHNAYIANLEEIALMANWKWQDKSYLIYTHLIHLMCNSSGGVLPNNEVVCNILSNININDSLLNYYNTIKSRQYLIDIPDYAIDKHTEQGRILGRDFRFFLEHGAVLNNEDLVWKEWSDFYLNAFKTKHALQ